MKFRIVYDGPLPSDSGGGSVEIKHKIRKYIHPQLKDLWLRHDALKELNKSIQRAKELKDAASMVSPDVISFLKIPHQIGSYEIWPLVSDHLKLLCYLDILFLRNEPPGSLIKKRQDEYGGDLDNRLKIFFDALRMPREEKELPRGAIPDKNEVPLYCLLEDDALITKFQVESDTLLGLAQTDPKHVRLIVQVSLQAVTVTQENLHLISG